MTTKAETRPYRVTLRVTSIVEVDVEASTIEEARAKAHEWNPELGFQEISGYWLGDDFVSEHDEMYWELIAVKCSEIQGVEALEIAQDEVSS